MIVTEIKRKRNQHRKRVAAYCRVSTAKESQEDSLDTQARYYKKLIFATDDWEFAGIYTDERSGLKTGNRPGFQRMIDDAIGGKIDLILVKSISRFSRNVVDCEQVVRNLRGQGVEVRFEREGISTFDPSCSMMFSLLAVIAENESKSISDNVKWSYAQRVKRGEYNLGNNRLLGYDCVEGKLVPNKDSWIIKLIFRLFLEGRTYKEIAEEVTKAGGHRMRSKRQMTATGLLNILRNETYVGDKKLQKEAPKDFYTKLPAQNVEYESNYLVDDHEAIISRDEWNRVQEILDDRQKHAESGVHFRVNSHPLYGHVFCGECGSVCVRRTEKKFKKEGEPAVYYKTWICAEHLKGKKGNGCKNPAVKEERVIATFGKSIDQLNESDSVRLYKKEVILSI